MNDVVEALAAGLTFDKRCVLGQFDWTWRRSTDVSVRAGRSSFEHHRRQAPGLTTGQHDAGSIPQRLAEVVAVPVIGANRRRPTTVPPHRAATSRRRCVYAASTHAQGSDSAAAAYPMPSATGMTYETPSAVEDLRADQVVLDQASGDRVAVGGAATVDEDVRLDREAITGAVAPGEVVVLPRSPSPLPHGRGEWGRPTDRGHTAWDAASRDGSA